MSRDKVFDVEVALPDEAISARAGTLLGFEARFARVRDQIRLLLQADELASWNSRYHGGELAVAGLVAEQYPLVIFHGDVGTGKTVTAECVANRLVAEAGAEDSTLFKLSNRVRGQRAGRRDGDAAGGRRSDRVSRARRASYRRAVLIIDEGRQPRARRGRGDHTATTRTR